MLHRALVSVTCALVPAHGTACWWTARVECRDAITAVSNCRLDWTAEWSAELIQCCRRWCCGSCSGTAAVLQYDHQPAHGAREEQIEQASTGCVSGHVLRHPMRVQQWSELRACIQTFRIDHEMQVHRLRDAMHMIAVS
jgi:hypothetical protein